MQSILTIDGGIMMKRFTVWILAAVTALLLCSCSESASSSEPVTETTSSSGVSAGFRFDWLSKITSITANVNGTEKSLPMQHSAVIELCNYFASKCEEEGYIHAIDYHFELSEKIVKLLEEKFDCQVVLTTHNTNLLSNSIMRPDCFLILHDGKLTPICDATTRELRQGHNLEKLYMSGEFDAE